MRESAVQMPDLIQTITLISDSFSTMSYEDEYSVPAIGGNRMAKSPKKMSLEHMFKS